MTTQVVQERPEGMLDWPQLKDRGWTQKLVHRMLGAPDAIVLRGKKLSLYRRQRVEQAEALPAYRVHRAKARRMAMPPGLLRRWARGEILDAKEWKECCEPEGMMLFLSRFDALAHRRERGTMLFACHAVKAALCHVHQDLLTEELQMFEEAECWHDVVTAVICGHFTVEREACEESEGESDDELLFDEPDRDCGCHDALEMATHAHYIERPEPGFYWGDDLFDRMAQKIGRDGVADLIRDLYGNPFAPVTVDPAWVNDTVLGLARDIYDEDAFRRMPLLASALVMAGCDHPEILAHCRQPGEHFRGCWLIDAILGN